MVDGYRAQAFESRNLLLFFIFAFGITWLSAGILAVFAPAVPTSPSDPAMLVTILAGLPGAFGPTIAAFIVTAISAGSAGVSALWRRFWNRNLPIGWLLVSLLGYDVMRLIANTVARLLDGTAYPVIDLSTPLWMVIPIFLQSFLLSGMGEEFGWRGFALPRFQAKWSALTSSILLGGLWAVWHLPFFFIPSQPLYQRNFWEWLPLIILSSVIYTWIFSNTGGSVLAAALFHAAFNSTIVILPTYASLWYYYGSVLIAVILIVAIFGSRNLVRDLPEAT